MKMRQEKNSRLNSNSTILIASRGPYLSLCCLLPLLMCLGKKTECISKRGYFNEETHSVFVCAF